MRFKLVIAALCVALVVPAAASARTVKYTGAVNNGGTISIAAKQKGKHGPIRIGTIKLVDVPAQCKEGVFPLGYATIGTFGLGRDLSFDFSISDKGGAKLEMDAKLSRKAKNFKGYIRMFGKFPTPTGAITGCETGQRGFVAKP